MAKEAMLEKRSEVLFVYDVTECNPNGDYLEENRPRTDPETNELLVSDVRIKRTIRDYWYERLGLEILVRDTLGEDGMLHDGKGRSKHFIEMAGVTKKDAVSVFQDKVKEAVLSTCIDARCFGAVLPLALEKGSIQMTGPVQFSGFNRSFHPVEVVFVKGPGGYASDEGKAQRTFREEYVAHYACIGVYGVINDLGAKKTKMTVKDKDLLLEGIWKGTLELVSRSKVGHRPLLLVNVEYEDDFRLGNLRDLVKLVTEKNGNALRNVGEYQLDIVPLMQALEDNKEHVSHVYMKKDELLQLAQRGEVNSYLTAWDKQKKLSRLSF